MRLALVILLVHGLAPALGEVVETAAHYALEGHLAHTAADQGDLGDQGDEHGCGTTQHHCGCCASQAVTAVPATPEERPVSPALGWVPAGASLTSLNDPAPPRRPPIAS